MSHPVTEIGLAYKDMIMNPITFYSSTPNSSLDTSSASDASGPGAAAAAPSSSTAHAQAPLRLSDMLKRKRVSNKRPSNRKGRQHSEGDLTAAAPATPSTSSAAAAHLGPSSPNSPAGGASSAAAAAVAAAAAYDLYGSSPPSDLALGPATPSRRSRLADRTSSLLSQLHPARWVKSSSGSNSANAAASAAVDGRKDGHNSASAAGSGGLSSTAAAAALLQKSASSPAAMALSKEKAKRWVREQASRFLESYFKESLGSRHPALTILRRLSAQVCKLWSLTWGTIPVTITSVGKH